MSRTITSNNKKPTKKIKVNVVSDNKSRLGFSIPTKKIKTIYNNFTKKLPVKARIPILVFISLLAIFILIISIKPLFFNVKSSIDEKISSSQNDPKSTQPQYKTITPSGNPIDQYGGWTRVSPSDKNPVFAFATNVNDVKVIVSQQPLPDDFKNDADVQTEQLAIGYKANEKITIGHNTVYIGTSANGPQSVIFHRDDLLILMKSSAKISNNDWIAFIESFK